MNQFAKQYLDIAYGFAKDLAVAGRIEAKPEAVAEFARSLALELAKDFKEPDATA